MGWASGTEAAEKGQVLGIDVKVEDDGQRKCSRQRRSTALQTRSSVPPSSLLIPQVANGPPNGPKHPADSLSYTLTLTGLFVFYRVLGWDL